MTEHYFREEKERLRKELSSDRAMLARDTNPNKPGSNRHHLTGNRLGLLQSDINNGHLTPEEAQNLRDYYLDGINLPKDSFKFRWENET